MSEILTISMSFFIGAYFIVSIGIYTYFLYKEGLKKRNFKKYDLVLVILFLASFLLATLTHILIYLCEAIENKNWYKKMVDWLKSDLQN